VEDDRLGFKYKSKIPLIMRVQNRFVNTKAYE
jgi:hypothetical protein